jgi:hypothetical protein
MVTCRSRSRFLFRSENQIELYVSLEVRLIAPYYCLNNNNADTTSPEIDRPR